MAATTVSASGLITANASGAGVKIVGQIGNPAYMHVDSTVNVGGKLWRIGYSGGLGGSEATCDIYNQTDNINVGVFSAAGLAVTGTISANFIPTATTATALLQSTGDATLRFNSQGGDVDKRKFEIRAIGASGFEALQFRTVNDANTVFTEIAQLASTGLAVTGKTTSTLGFDGTLGATTPSTVVATTISTSNNIRVGGASSVWSAPFDSSVIEVGTAGTSFFGQGGTPAAYVGANHYYNGGNLYKIAGEATLYRQFVGVHSFYTAPAGAEDGAVVFTERATISAAGLAVTGALTCSTGFGANGNAAQTKASVNAASTDLETVVALCNQLRTALVANGICV